MNPLTFLAEIFPLAGLVVLVFSFASPFPWKLNPAPAMQLRPYVAPEGYLPDIQCSSDATVLAALNGTCASASSTTVANTTIARRGTLAKARPKEGDEGGDDGGLGDFFSSLLSSGSGGGTPLDIAPHGDFNEHPNATVRLWLGPLGSCSRDLDGRKWCTRPSYHRPQYNISSFISPNAYLYPAVIQAQTLARTTLAFIILASLSLLLSILGNFKAELNYVPIFYNVCIGVAEFVTLWVWFSRGSVEAGMGAGNPRQLNTISRLFECNQTTGAVQIMGGTQYYVFMGDHYGLLWASWVLVSVMGTVASIIRVIVGDGDSIKDLFD